MRKLFSLIQLAFILQSIIVVSSLNCAESFHSFNGDYCRPCPLQAICDGSSIIRCPEGMRLNGLLGCFPYG